MVVTNWISEQASSLGSMVYFVFSIFIFIGCGSSTENITSDPISSDPWKFMNKVEAGIKVPDFRKVDFNVADFGAVGDGVSRDGLAIQKAIEKCSSEGGGRVVVAKGIYKTGPIHLLSNVNLYLEEGAELSFSTDPNEYLPLVRTSFEGIELSNYSPLIYAYEQQNIAITGSGILNGNASSENWWTWKGSREYGWQEGMPHQNEEDHLPAIMRDSEIGLPLEKRLYGQGYYLRPTFIEPNRCKNILIKGVTIKNGPFWIIHPFMSESVIVDGVTVDSHGPNNDGCNPEYCKNVIIKNSVFNTGDDCIAIKAGRDADGRRVGKSSENIIVRNCQMKDGHGGVVIGSESSGGVKNIFVEDCKMDSPNLDRAIRIKTNSRRGGTTQNLFVRNLDIGQVKECVLKLNMQYGIYKDQKGGYPPTIKNIYLENVNVKDGGEYAILAMGLEESKIKDVFINNLVIEKVNEGFKLEHTDGIFVKNSFANGKKLTIP